jgi:hypothetical protein
MRPIKTEYTLFGKSSHCITKFFASQVLRVIFCDRLNRFILSNFYADIYAHTELHNINHNMSNYQKSDKAERYLSDEPSFDHSEKELLIDLDSF